jgi:hypothetical protein
MSATPDLTNPAPISLNHVWKEDAAITKLISSMKVWSHKFDFIVVEHPDKMNTPFERSSEQWRPGLT